MTFHKRFALMMERRDFRERSARRSSNSVTTGPASKRGMEGEASDEEAAIRGALGWRFIKPSQPWATRSHPSREASRLGDGMDRERDEPADKCNAPSEHQGNEHLLHGSESRCF